MTDEPIKRHRVNYPPCPRGPYVLVVNEDGSKFIADRDGNDVMQHPEGPARLVECANAVPTVWFPVAHVAALEELAETHDARIKVFMPDVPNMREISN